MITNDASIYNIFCIPYLQQIVVFVGDYMFEIGNLSHIRGCKFFFYPLVSRDNNATVHKAKVFVYFCVAADIPAMADQSLDIADEVQYAT